MIAEFRVQIGTATVTAGYAAPFNAAYPQGATMADGWAFVEGRPPQDMRQPFVGVDLPHYSDTRLAPEEAGLLAATLTAAAAFATRQAEEARRQGPPPSPLEVKP